MEQKRLISRRQFIRLTTLTGIGAAIAACAPATTVAPTAAPATAVPATKAPEATKPPATAVPTVAPTTAPMVKPPIPYPNPNKIDVGGAEVKRQAINQIVTYKKLDKYTQAPMLDKFVADGTLPPVEKRLPKEPAVMLKTGMKDGPGIYGDLWRGFFACPITGWNDYGGATMGWFGIESYTTRYGGLVATGPLYRATQDIEPMPQLAKSWSWSADGKELTMKLIEGAFWSDGVPFDADDVMFTWEAYVLDDKVAGPPHLDTWTWDGKPAKLEKVDAYTIKFTFPVSKPLDAFYLMHSDRFHVMPKHQLAEFHPKFSTKTPAPSYKDFTDALPPTKLPIVTMGPWVITEYKTDELLIMRRNPYFWRVDENGQQLPYFDEVQYRQGPSGIGRDLCVLAGDCDLTNLENPSSFVETMTKAQDPNSKFQVTWGPETLGYMCWFNYSLDLGIKSPLDTAVRTLFRDLRFRQALSYATDREGIAQSIMKGPFLRGWAGGLYPGAPDFDKPSVVYYPYDVASAKILLEQCGLKDTNNDKFLEWTSGPTAGQTVILQMSASQDAKETQSVAEALVNQWAAVGIKVNMKVQDSATRTDISNNSTWDIIIDRGGQAFALPFTNPQALAPITKTFNIHREGPDKPRTLMDFEKELIDLVQKYRSTFVASERKNIMASWNYIWTKNVYNLGIFVGRYGLGIAKRVKNIPDGTPVFMYTWVEDAVMLDCLWTPKEAQLKQNRPDTIPIYAKK